MTDRSLGRRKRFALLLATTLAAVGFTIGTATAATITFSNNAAIAIPDNKNADPFPSAITVSGAGSVQKVTATLKGFTHTCPSDVAVLLAGPSGANSILMGKGNGGCNDTDPVDVTFDQSATNPVPAALVSGTFRPTSSTAPTPFSPPAPIGPTYPVDLNQFVGKSGSGDWKLFVADQVSGDLGAIVRGWSLTLTAPFNTATLGTPRINKKKGNAQLPVTVVDAGTLTLSGKGVKAASASKSVAVGGPGTINLPVMPKGKTSKKLTNTGKATVKVTVTFTPNGGSASVQTTKIKLKKTL
jgi:subtilisin-like proprotein convertase family protein